jgi:succinate dehydrogenase hydrophobic anchor subunit
MLDSLLQAIEDWIRELFTGMVNANLTTMFTDVNEKTSEIAAQVGQTPQGWNGSVFSMIQGLSNIVIVPIAGIIITMVLCYELITMLTERNNLHDVDTWMFFKYFVKMWIAVYLVSNTFTIVMAVFDVGQSVVSSAAGYISGTTAIDVQSMIGTMERDGSHGNSELMMLALETALVSLCMKILSFLIMVILYGRMIEIYLYSSVAPIHLPHVQQRVGTDWHKLFQRFAGIGIPGIPDDGVRLHLCGADFHHEHHGSHSYGAL